MIFDKLINDEEMKIKNLLLFYAENNSLNEAIGLIQKCENKIKKYQKLQKDII